MLHSVKIMIDGVSYSADMDIEWFLVKGEPKQTATPEAVKEFERMVVLQLIHFKARGPEACRYLVQSLPYTDGEKAELLRMYMYKFHTWKTRPSGLPDDVYEDLIEAVKGSL